MNMYVYGGKNVLLIICCSGYLGFMWEWRRSGQPAPPKPRWFPNKLHVWLGRLMMLLVIAELYLGLVEYQSYVQPLVWGLTGWLLFCVLLLVVFGVWRFCKRVLSGVYSPKPKYAEVVSAPPSGDIISDNAIAMHALPTVMAVTRPVINDNDDDSFEAFQTWKSLKK
jgi:hypothetical protein